MVMKSNHIFLPAFHDSCILLRHHLIAVIHNKRILQINYQRLKTQTCNKFRLPELFSIFEHHILTFRMCFLFHPFPHLNFSNPNWSGAMLERLSSQDLLPWILGSVDARHVWRVALSCAELHKTATRPQSLLTLAESCKVGPRDE